MCCQVPNPASRAPSGWEQPPGLGTATMSTVFEACQEVYNWLALDEDNVAVGGLLACRNHVMRNNTCLLLRRRCT